jgi:PPE-repeat protein
MQSRNKWATAIIEVPEKMNFIDKKGNIKPAKTLTKTKNLASRNKQKAIILESNNNINDIKIISQGEKLEKQKKIKKNEIQNIKEIDNTLEQLKKEYKKNTYSELYNNNNIISDYFVEINYKPGLSYDKNDINIYNKLKEMSSRLYKAISEYSKTSDKRIDKIQKKFYKDNENYYLKKIEEYKK